MKERIGIHFGVSFIYSVVSRNFLGDGYLYTTTMTSFQMSLIYCLLMALFLTILLETWDIVKELTVHKIEPLLIMFLSIIVSFIAIYFLQSIYYSLIIIYLLFYVCRDCWYMNVMNSELMRGKK